MFSKLLVANRGEIARRVFRTCREMGIRTVAVYSDPDRDAPFVQEADEGIALGGSAPAESYLRGDAVIEAALRTGAGAIHPGYGFLSENASFATAVDDAGLTWVGPPASAIETMGSKLASKKLMAAAGVPTLPSVDLTGLDDDTVAGAAGQIGFPVLVKASAGGGGKGMRIVSNPDDLLEAVAGARRESLAAFGDETVFLEKYLTRPRHVEIQVFGDSHGNLVSLFERDCSIQRRHQKIIEEAPSPAIDAATRAEMGSAAVDAARAVEYVGAGTVEFLFSRNQFWFLEMNTRLQVEHPVTEAVTGLDLVRLQLLVAAGEPLPDEALHPTMSGHAIEARLYAENPRNEFLPVTGSLTAFEFPTRTGLRVDSGVESGSDVSVHYDPMLAKVIAKGSTRRETALALADALARARIDGIVTNRELLVAILREEEFLDGSVDTHYLQRHDPADLAAPLADRAETATAALAAALAAQRRRVDDRTVLASIRPGWRNVPSSLQMVSFDSEHGEITVGYRFVGDRSAVVSLDGEDAVATVVVNDGARVGIEVDGHLRWYAVTSPDDTRHSIVGPQGMITLTQRPRFPEVGLDEDPGSLHAPMPGKVIEVQVDVGDRVDPGQVLVVMEAMKMEHTLRAPAGGSVTEVRVTIGDQVGADEILVVVDED